MIFPKNASTKERETNWQLITEIKDADFGFNTPKKKTNNTKFSVRILLFNEKQEICVIESGKYGYIQLPGGGVNEGESISKGLKRETREETGFLIKNIKPLGYVIEKREDIKNTHDWDQNISYIFAAEPEKYVGTNYTKEEVDEEFKPIWLRLEEFIVKKEKSNSKSYSGCFSDRRDLEATKYYLSLIKQD